MSMDIYIEEKNKVKIAKLSGNVVLINELDDAIDLLGNSDYLGASCMILLKEQINPDFFDLKTGLAGDILQKFSNYNKRLAIVGDFSNISSKSLNDFIRESNRSKSINFVGTMEEAEEILSK